MVANAPEAIDQLDFRKLMQLAAEQELVTTWQTWMTNGTSPPMRMTPLWPMKSTARCPRS
jgi:hypothetical protein